MEILNNNSQDSNFSEIASYITKEFPIFHSGNSESIVDAVTDEIIGSRQVRIGPAPSVESLYEIRKVIRYAVENGNPIPILTVSAPKKPVPMAHIDIAELSMMNMLSCLNKRVKNHYQPGIVVNIRIEDITGTWLEEGSEMLNESIEMYSTEMEILPKILDYGFIHTRRESDMPGSGEYLKIAENVYPDVVYYIISTDSLPESSWDNKYLSRHGFNGYISIETRKFYYDRYKRIFGDKPQHFFQQTLAKYYSGIIARTKLKMIGNDGLGLDYIYLSFTSQVPGVNPIYTRRKIYYRSIPLNVSKMDIPFWRSKGIIKINGSATPALIHWNDNVELKEMSVTLVNGNNSVVVQTDYMEV